MRLLNFEIDDRVKITLDKTIKEDGVNGIMTFGVNNDYPQTIEKLINGSQTAKMTSQVYAKFLAGNGFLDARLNGIVIGRDARGKNITMHSLLRQTAQSISKFNAFYWHLSFNPEIKVGSVQLKDFKNIRFAKPDDTGYSAKVVYSDDWKNKKVTKKDYNLYNVNPDVFRSQVEKAGGFDKFKGQIYFQSFDDEYFYPLSVFDSVYLDMDTEAQIALYKNRQIRNGFFDKVVFRVAPQPKELDANGQEIENGNDELAKSIRSFMGADGETALVLEDHFSETGEIEQNGSFRIDRIQSTINDKLFEGWEKSLANSIRKSAKGVPAILIDYEQSNLGNTSGESVRAACDYYNAITQLERDTIQMCFYEIFKNSANEQLAALTKESYVIEPLNIADYGTDNT